VPVSSQSSSTLLLHFSGPQHILSHEDHMMIRELVVDNPIPPEEYFGRARKCSNSATGGGQSKKKCPALALSALPSGGSGGGNGNGGGGGGNGGGGNGGGGGLTQCAGKNSACGSPSNCCQGLTCNKQGTCK
jgi:hypothetical protein